MSSTGAGDEGDIPSAQKLSYKDFLPRPKGEKDYSFEILPIRPSTSNNMSAAGTSKQNDSEDPTQPAIDLSQEEENSDDEDDEEYDDVNGGVIEGLRFYDTENESEGETRELLLSQSYAMGELSSSIESETEFTCDSDDESESGIFNASGLPVDLNDYDHIISKIALKPRRAANKISSIKNQAKAKNLRYIEEESLNISLEQENLHFQRLDKLREDIRKRVCFLSSNPGIHGYGCRMYNPADYDGLKVSPDVKEIFQYITQYSPIASSSSQLDVKIRPFIPEYYPSVGDIDAFIKVVNPEINKDELGIRCLDEPSAFQSDPSVLDLRLRSLAKQSSAKAVVVKRVENVGKNSKIIENWIKDISDLHRSKPSPSVHYSKPMPDIDILIQEWPPEIEDILKDMNFPSADLDCDLNTYVDIVCSLLDIPVYKNRIQSLHVLCTLYATYKHFNQYGPLGRSTDGDLQHSSVMMMNQVDMVDHLLL